MRTGKKRSAKNRNLPRLFTAAVFVGSMAVLAVANFLPRYAYRVIREAEPFELDGLAAKIEERFNDRFRPKLPLADVYGTVQRLLGKNECGNFDVVRALTGSFHVGRVGHTELIAREHYSPEDFGYLKRFNEFCAARGVPFVCALVPSKVIQGYTELPTGISTHENGNNDRLRDTLRKLGIDILDFRELPGWSSLNPGEIFYKTDNHWTVDTAFWAHNQMIAHLTKKYGLEFPMADVIGDPDNYNREFYPGSFIGTTGIRAGWGFAQREDFTLVTPKYPTEFEFISHGKTTRGDFEVLLNRRRSMNMSRFKGNRYAAYLHSNDDERTIINRNGKYNVLVVQDSQGLPFSFFLAQHFYKMTVLDIRDYTEKSVSRYIMDDPEYDLVICVNLFVLEQF